jgi:hypothetical protein
MGEPHEENPASAVASYERQLNPGPQQELKTKFTNITIGSQDLGKK